MPFSSTLPYYRTTGPWGAGLGVDLVNSYVDIDFYTLIQNDNYLLALINGFITVPPTSIADFIVAGNQFYVQLTNHTLLGPYPLPSAIWTVVPGGIWQPNTAYVVNDVFTINGTVYLVIFPYPGSPVFDPGANDGHGHNYFQAILTVPGNVLPVGGSTGEALLKHSSTDFDVFWGRIALESLSDVLINSITLAVGDTLRWSGVAWVNLSDTVENLFDVVVHAVANGQTIVWNSTNSNWENGVPIMTLEELSDVAISLPTNGQTITWNSTTSQWVNSTPTAAITLEQLTDVSITPSPNPNDLLQFDPGGTFGADWTNVQPVTIQCTYVATVATTTYTFAITDIYGYLRATNASGCAFTIPPNSSVAFPINTEITIRAATSGSVTVAAGGGVTLNVPSPFIATLLGLHSTATVKQVATDVWDLMGLLQT